MKTIFTYALFTRLLFSVAAQRSEPTSKTDEKLKTLLEKRSQLDTNKDGVLTLSELRAGRDRARERQSKRPEQRKPTFADVSYGENDSMKLDFWQAQSDAPTPLFIFIHGGGFRNAINHPSGFYRRLSLQRRVRGLDQLSALRDRPLRSHGRVCAQPF